MKLKEKGRDALEDRGCGFGVRCENAESGVIAQKFKGGVNGGRAGPKCIAAVPAEIDLREGDVSRI